MSMSPSELRAFLYNKDYAEKKRAERIEQLESMCRSQVATKLTDEMQVLTDGRIIKLGYRVKWACNGCSFASSYTRMSEHLRRNMDREHELQRLKDGQ